MEPLVLLLLILCAMLLIVAIKLHFDKVYDEEKYRSTMRRVQAENELAKLRNRNEELAAEVNELEDRMQGLMAQGAEDAS